MASQNEDLLKIEIRSYILKSIAENDSNRYRNRIVLPKKGKGRKNRPRNSNRVHRDTDD